MNIRFGIIDYGVLGKGPVEKTQSIHIKGEGIVIINVLVSCLVGVWFGFRRTS